MSNGNWFGASMPWISCGNVDTDRMEPSLNGFNIDENKLAWWSAVKGQNTIKIINIPIL